MRGPKPYFETGAGGRGYFIRSVAIIIAGKALTAATAFFSRSPLLPRPAILLDSVYFVITRSPPLRHWILFRFIHFDSKFSKV